VPRHWLLLLLLLLLLLYTCSSLLLLLPDRGLRCERLQLLLQLHLQLELLVVLLLLLLLLLLMCRVGQPCDKRHDLRELHSWGRGRCKRRRLKAQLKAGPACCSCLTRTSGGMLTQPQTELQLRGSVG
jgi:hypothetical protein